MDVTVYTTPTCPYCRMAKDYLTQRGVPFTERDVAADPAAAAEAVRISRQRGVPIIAADGQVVVGFDRPGLDRLIEAVKANRPSLGLAVADASKIAIQQGQVPVFGAYVGRVRPGSVGERMGIQQGDVITHINVRPVRTAADVEQAMAVLEPGNRVTVVLQRGGRELRTEATL
ncbi:MAG TPA: Uxx-star family glutaredoxin-like (seleno)protein [Chloroflexota bacterium]|nr:Uxx-star family glutaredoxin-like (seleno)protein [Chloroflexota bacterium]